MTLAITRPEVQEYHRGEFVISTDRERLDLDVIYGFLTECYWAKGIPRELVARSIENSLCFGVYSEGRQVGFARIISDYATYAYIGDVFVLEPYRGHGLGKWLVECIMRDSAPGIAPLELGDGRRPRAVRAIWFHEAEVARKVHGTMRCGGLQTGG